MHKGDIEWHSGVLRVFAPGKSKQNRDHYVWCCTVQRVGDTAILSGVLEAPSATIRKAGIQALASQGVRFVEWERWEPGSGEPRKKIRVRIA